MSPQAMSAPQAAGGASTPSVDGSTDADRERAGRVGEPHDLRPPASPPRRGRSGSRRAPPPTSSPSAGRERVEVEEPGRRVERHRPRRRASGAHVVERSASACRGAIEAGTRTRRRPVSRPAIRSAVAAGLEAVVDRDVDDVHLEQLAHHRRVLEERLEAPVVLVRLAGVGGEELAAAVDLVADGRHVVLVAAGAEEAERRRAWRCCRSQQPLDVADQLRLGAERRGQVERRRRAAATPGCRRRSSSTLVAPTAASIAARTSGIAFGM